MRISEDHSAGRELVDVGRRDFAGWVKALHVAIAEVIAEDVYDVRLCGSTHGAAQRQREYRQQSNEIFDLHQRSCGHQGFVVTQVFKPAVSPISKSAKPTKSRAGLETRDTAQRDEAATKRSLSSIALRRGPGRGGAFVHTSMDCPSP